MLSIYDIDNPAKLRQIFDSALQDKDESVFTYKNVSGHQDTTFLVNNKWIIKLGLSEDDYDNFDRQRDIINILRPRIRSVELPQYKTKDLYITFDTGERTIIRVAMYPKTEGIVLSDFNEITALPITNRVQIMKSAARFLSALHQIALADIEHCFPNNPYYKVATALRKVMPDFQQMNKRKQVLLTTTILKNIYPDLHVCHRDFRPQNFCLNEELNKITSVFDFGCADIDTPETDVLAFVRNEHDRSILKSEYEKLTKHNLNPVKILGFSTAHETTGLIQSRVKAALQKMNLSRHIHTRS